MIFHLKVRELLRRGQHLSLEGRIRKLRPAGIYCINRLNAIIRTNFARRKHDV
jgi:hypothetical protein